MNVQREAEIQALLEGIALPATCDEQFAPTEPIVATQKAVQKASETQKKRQAKQEN
jgi:hypothetical protein